VLIGAGLEADGLLALIRADMYRIKASVAPETQPWNCHRRDVAMAAW
jgi:hypothetical protein